jgi:hypothetical protein
LLLLDVHFQHGDWWRSAADPSGPANTPPQPSFFPMAPAADLMREAMVLAWHVARSDCNVAQILLGLTPAVANTIAALAVRDLGRITGMHCQEIRPRWERHSSFWRRLLLAASSAHENSLHEVRLHGLQLLGGDLIPSSR